MADGRTSSHGTHDVELVAAFATGDSAADQAARAAQLVASCAHCRQLADDVLALRLATRAMRALPVPARTRDFRLSPETAARLRPASPWERFRRSLVGPSGVGRPLAASLMTLGLAGLLVSAVSLLPASFSTLAQRDATTGSLAAPESNFAAGGAVPQAVAGGATAGSGAKSAPGSSPVSSVGPAAVALPPDVAVASAGTARGPDPTPAPTPGMGVIADQGVARASSDPVASGTPGPPPSDEHGAALALAASSVVVLLAGFGLLLARRRAAHA